MKPLLLETLFILPLPLFVSCGGLAEPKKDGIVYCEVAGELYHKQYWDYNDKWDLKNMSLLLHYDDGTTESISATTKNASYVFDPASPVGLDHSVKSFKLVSGIYTDYAGKNHPIKEREFYPITIIDYPRSKDNNLFWPILVSICLIGIGASIFVLTKKITNK